MNFSVYGVYLFKDLFYDRGRSILTIISLTAVIVSYLAASAISDVFHGIWQSAANRLARPPHHV